eukprot:PhF_6_TR5571/c0_g1_i1/m.7974
MDPTGPPPASSTPSSAAAQDDTIIALPTRIIKKTSEFLKLFNWGKDDKTRESRASVSRREAPPIKTDISPQLQPMVIPNSTAIRAVHEYSKQGPPKQAVLVITGDLFVVCEPSGKVKRVTPLEHIKTIFVQDRLSANKKDRDMMVLVSFASYVPERDFLCDLSTDPMNGEKLNNDQSLVASLMVVIPEVECVTLTQDQNIEQKWEYAPPEPDVTVERLVCRIAESRAANIINTYPQEMNVPMTMSQQPSQSTVRSASVQFSPPPRHAQQQQQYNAAQNNSLGLVPVPGPSSSLSSSARKAPGVDRAITALIVDTQERRFVSTGVGDDTVEERASSPTFQHVHQAHSELEAMYLDRLQLLNDPPDIAAMQRDTVAGTVWLSPPLLTYLEHQKAYQRPAVNVVQQGGGPFFGGGGGNEFISDQGNQQFLRNHCKTLMTKLFQAQYPERLPDIERMLDSFRGQEDKLSLLLTTELQDMYMEMDASRRNREQRIHFLTHVL